MPLALLSTIVDHVDSLMTPEEAETYRLQLMDERTAGVAEHDETYFATEFDMCEH
ncbi:hypothetical protein FRB95_008179 [Tulasnella sp. JGI-2019a]|nr:hypothetical protein FRB95_008179 [Tulasnella sp. JGI-2019a]